MQDFPHGCTTQTAQLYLEQTTLYFAFWLRFARVPICNDIFPILINRDFFTSEIGPDIPINMLDDCITFLIWSAWVLFNFSLEQKQMFPVWSFTEKASFISFQGRICYRYSEISLKEAKTYLFKNNKITLKNQFSKATSSIIIYS